MDNTNQASAEDIRLGRRIPTDPSPWPSEDICLQGTYITLTGLAKSDMPSLWRNLNFSQNPHLLDFIAMQPPQTEQELWQAFEHYRHGRGMWVYAIKCSPDLANLTKPDADMSSRTEAVGTLAYLDVQPAHRALEVGAVLFSPALQRTPAATEANYLLLKYAMDGGMLSPPYRRVVWKCNALNGASKHAAERLGFVYEGTFRNHMIAKGRSRDSAWFSVLEEEWLLAKAALEEWLSPGNFDGEGRQIRRLEDVRRNVEVRSSIREQ